MKIEKKYLYRRIFVVICLFISAIGSFNFMRINDSLLVHIPFATVFIVSVAVLIVIGVVNIIPVVEKIIDWCGIRRR